MIAVRYIKSDNKNKRDEENMQTIYVEHTIQALHVNVIFMLMNCVVC